MLSKYVKGTYTLLFCFIVYFLFASFLVRLLLLVISAEKTQLSFVSVLRIFGEGSLFDFGVAAFFGLPYALYLLFLPVKWNNSMFNKIITYAAFTLAILITMFSFFAEFTFWQEFESRFNFIAVDYLVYTYEVINNINESYPIPILVGGMLCITLLIVWIFNKQRYFYKSFQATTGFKYRLVTTFAFFAITLIYGIKVNSSLAETSDNRYQNELAKAGIYSFFSAFKNNELNYDHFYKLIDNKKAFSLVRNQLSDSSSTFTGTPLSIRRTINSNGKQYKPNVIMITIESFSADFMAHFGNKKGLTPVLDSLADKGLLFTNMYATGTRTVRGMEALCP